jgi:hypothetical protein
MGCLVIAYGPLVRSVCSSLTAGAALHIAPSTSRAHTVNAVADTRITSPRIRIQAACRARACQSARGTAKSMAIVMTSPGQTAEPYQERVRSAGARDS